MLCEIHLSNNDYMFLDNVVKSEQPLELLTSLMPTAIAPLAGHSYAVEHAPAATVSATSVSGNIQCFWPNFMDRC